MDSPPIPLTAAGRRLEAYWIGPPRGSSPTLVFLHEGLGSAQAWLKFAEPVAAATECGALVYSRAGYGSSDPADLPFSVRFMHDEALIVLPEILDAMRIEDAILVGHSDGASIALIHAAGPGAGRIRTLVLEAPHVFVESVTVDSIAALPERFHHGDLRRKLERLHGANTERTFQGCRGRSRRSSSLTAAILLIATGARRRSRPSRGSCGKSSAISYNWKKHELHGELR